MGHAQPSACPHDHRRRCAADRTWSKAFVWFEKLLSQRKVNETDVQIFKTAFQSAGWRGVLREWLKKFEKIGGTTFDRALYNAQLGEKDQAFDYLEKVYERREVWVTYLRVEPRLDPLRDDPRFAEVLRRVEGK